MLMRHWTPSSQVATTPIDNTDPTQNQRTRLRWCKVLVSALIPLVIFGFCIVYTLQQQTFFNEDYQHKQQDQYDEQQRVLFNTYIDDISNILVKIDDKNFIEKYRFYIQTKTFILLKDLNIKRKKDIIIFLYENNLIQNDQFKFYGADLNNVELMCPHDFHHLSLPGVHWSNAIFINCRLTSSNFNEAYLFNARFVNSTIDSASFIQANLEHSQFIQTIILNTDFSGALLFQSNFLQADTVQGNNFTNADLYQSKLTKGQLEGKKFSILKHDFNHARYPNGSFHLFNSDENLILNGNAEISCSDENQTIWKTIESDMKLFSEFNENNNNSYLGNCSFVISSETRVYQNINLHSYSLLIDTNNAELTFSAITNCSESYSGINMYRSDDILNGLQTYLKPTKEMISEMNKTMYVYRKDQTHLLIHTRRIEIYFGIEKIAMDTKCYFDNIILKIEQKLNSMLFI